MIPSKLEVLVDFGVKPDEKLLERTLSTLKAQDGVTEAVFQDGAIMVETVLPNQQVLELVGKTSGRRTVLQGFGDSESAVAILQGDSSINGVIRFQQVGEGTLIADGSIDGVPPGSHGLHVHSTGDTSEGCKSIGPHFNPNGGPHGGPGCPPEARHAGDLGNIVADENGRATFRIVDNVLKVSDMIGRAISVSERADDLGKGSTDNSKLDGDSGPAIACGIIARSAGIFQNPKRICLCDGVVVWDERDRPLAGTGRRVQNGGQGDTGVHSHGKKSCCNT